MTMTKNNERGSALVGTTVVGCVIAVLIAIIWFWVWQAESFGSTDGGHVAIVRNGGPFDNTKIRQVLPGSSGRTNIGFASSQHNYPTSQRFFTISGHGNADSNDVVTVPTADGVHVGIEGTAYFTLNTSSAGKYATLKDFDNKYGTRTFKCTDKQSKHVYDGDAGFSCFLDQIVSPIINNDLRVSLGNLNCADLVASCSLVQNSLTGGTAQLDKSKIGKGNLNLAKVEQDISTSLQEDMTQTLGGNFITVERFNLSGVDLPDNVQNAIDDAQAQFASVSKAQAQQKTELIQASTRLQQAKIDAQANEARQKGYNNCPTCAAIDQTKALPSGITVYAPGNNNVAIPAK